MEKERDENTRVGKSMPKIKCLLDHLTASKSPSVAMALGLDCANNTAE